ncbi:MAG: hypothetical protein A3F68_08115 [Acidobacteria bacterium RIFCSPLOWO2_12_FULL_54_10]|nr:MAG: hypothetical protein A3F68_08115 [Acidobacteria bacterium RIFCSPLOWO2_12_FULL_54_10]
MTKLRYLATACFLLILSVHFSFAADPQKDIEKRVNEFYEAFSKGNMKTAEKFVHPESIQMFRAQAQSAILKYQLRKIDITPDGKEAFITMGVDSMVPLLGKVMTLDAQTTWRIHKGKWYLALGAPPPIHVLKAQEHPPDKKATELQFEKTAIDFGWKRQGDVVQVEFPFTNISDHAVTVSAALVSDCNCIEVQVTKPTLAPGEKSSVLFRVASSPFLLDYHQGIGIKVEPGGGILTLDVFGFLAPADQNPPTESTPASP